MLGFGGKEPPHMRRSTRLIAAVVVAVTAVVLSACSGGQGPGAVPERTTAAEAVQDATFFYVTNLDIVTSWDPAVSYSNEIIVMQNVYESLTRYNPVTKKAGPLLATA